MIELNIGLDVNLALPSHRAGIRAKNRRAAASILKALRAENVGDYVTRYTDPDGEEVEEHGVYAQLPDGRPFDADLISTLNTWCTATLQDCIAVRFSAAYGVGVLVGPNAAKWGAFNPDYFKVPSAADVAKAA